MQRLSDILCYSYSGEPPVHTYAVAVVRVLKSRVAQTVVGAHSVLAGPVATGLPLTLIHV